MRKLQLSITAAFVLVMLVASSLAFAGKPTGYAPTLSTSLATPSALSTTSSANGTFYVISGCGYDAAYGMVTVEVFTPVGVGWVAQAPDANGCITVTNFYTVGSGDYKIDAWQQLRNKAQVVAETTFTV